MWIGVECEMCAGHSASDRSNRWSNGSCSSSYNSHCVPLQSLYMLLCTLATPLHDISMCTTADVGDFCLRLPFLSCLHYKHNNAILIYVWTTNAVRICQKFFLPHFSHFCWMLSSFKPLESPWRELERDGKYVLANKR